MIYEVKLGLSERGSGSGREFKWNVSVSRNSLNFGPSGRHTVLNVAKTSRRGRDELENLAQGIGIEVATSVFEDYRTNAGTGLAVRSGKMTNPPRFDVSLYEPQRLYVFGGPDSKVVRATLALPYEQVLSIEDRELTLVGHAINRAWREKLPSLQELLAEPAKV